MATEDEHAELNDAEEQTDVSHRSAAASAADSALDGDENPILGVALRTLPLAAVKNLLSDGVCFRCILRLFSKYGRGKSLSCHVSDDSQEFSNPCGENEFSGGGGANGSQPSEQKLNEPDFCCVCCGILQLSYIDSNWSLMKHKSVTDFTLSISELVKREGHQADGFTLEVSIPPSIIEKENAARLLMEKRYGSEAWFLENIQSEVLSVKDCLKFSFTSTLEAVLGVKCGISSFRIRLSYSCLEAAINKEKIMDKNQASKRRKTGTDSDGEAVQGLFSSEEHNLTINGGSLYINSNCQQVIRRCCTALEGKVTSCLLEVHSYRLPVFIGGRYLKYSRNVSQTRWIIGEERKGEASVEEIVGGTILPKLKGDNYKFHAAGREDIDVRMLGSGRPFLVEVQNARVVPSATHLKDIEDKINSLDNKLVGVKNLKVVDNEGWTLMREGEAEKQKEYVAIVWISRPLENEDLCTISSAKDMKITQRTPVRVLHRRSPLDREKIIHWMKIEKIAGSSQYFLLHLCTQAGTYIKEFVHGDLGRTHPSIGSILGCRAEILQLDVTDVKMDCF